ncbi:ribonuclease H-like domain-containing protein [Thermoflavifilum thermophilum]|uniref:Predicted 3'-5' exonuclease PolB-like domain-containing protein n=1 Tax=Thermoflavifilum thermophilum TaxID=1393122 RepID=A0A1I7NG84_9BACT|nr:ribonuclease H-like domain-containing protein [Thermoflavifilum thermophilum]SFV33669.1 hypothetical protein SAMN05660895_1778 [Thermoflavifilum thermophilum]
MLNQLNLSELLLIDIETVPGQARFEEISPALQELWIEKHSKIKPESGIPPSEAYAERAGIYAEFGKIICISAGYFTASSGDITQEAATHFQFRVTSFFGDQESEILQDFFQVVKKVQHKPGFRLAGHNIQEFDLPYICRRALIQGLALPEALQLYGKKPWEVPVLDTLHLWRFGDYKHYTSLQLLTTVLGIPSPKEDLHGSEVAKVYWQDHDFERIVQYCQKDVVAVAQLLLRLQNLPLLEDQDIQYV